MVTSFSLPTAKAGTSSQGAGQGGLYLPRSLSCQPLHHGCPQREGGAGGVRGAAGPRAPGPHLLCPGRHQLGLVGSGDRVVGQCGDPPPDRAQAPAPRAPDTLCLLPPDLGGSTGELGAGTNTLGWGQMSTHVEERACWLGRMALGPHGLMPHGAALGSLARPGCPKTHGSVASPQTQARSGLPPPPTSRNSFLKLKTIKSRSSQKVGFCQATQFAGSPPA